MVLGAPAWTVRGRRRCPARHPSRFARRRARVAPRSRRSTRDRRGRLQLGRRIPGTRRRAGCRRSRDHRRGRRGRRAAPGVLHGLQRAQAARPCALPAVRSRPSRNVHRRGRGLFRSRGPRDGSRPWRGDLRRTGRARDDDGRLPRHRTAPRRGRHGARHARRAGDGGGGAGRRRLRERSRDRHSAQRSHRGSGPAHGLWRGRSARQLDEVDDRSHDGGGGEPGGAGDRAGPDPRRRAADRSPGHARSGGSLRLCAERGPRGDAAGRDLELVRLRRPERHAALPARMLRPVVVTGVGVVSARLVGTGAALRRFLAAPPAASPRHVVDASVLAGLIDGAEARRTSRVSQLALAATRLALADARLDDTGAAGFILGTEHGDLHSTIEFADGYLRTGPTGLSPLLFPNTVMNTMAAAATIAVQARQLSLTLNVRTVGGELAVARAARAVASGRVEVALAGGVDQHDPLVAEILGELGAGSEVRGEGATLLVLESLEHARARGASPAGEILGCAWRGLAARPHGVGHRVESTAIAAALQEAGLAADVIAWAYTSASGDRSRDAWEEALLGRALGPQRLALASLAPLLRPHAGVG